MTLDGCEHRSPSYLATRINVTNISHFYCIMNFTSATMNVFTSSSQFSKSEATMELQAMTDLVATKTVTFSVNNDLCYVSHFFDMLEDDYQFLYNKVKEGKVDVLKAEKCALSWCPQEGPSTPSEHDS